MKLSRRLGIILGTLVLAAGSLVAGVARADVIPTDQSCTTFPGGPSNDVRFTYLGDRGSLGSVYFYSNGEILRVGDYASNGLRVVALFSWCVSGTWQTYIHRDSGPDEGATDSEEYNFDFAEGRGIKFKACQKNMTTGKLYNCGGIYYTHA